MKWRWRARKERSLEREIQAHLDLEAEEQEAAGLAPGDARVAARRTLGNPTLLKEVTRETWGWAAVERAQQDLRYAMRVLRKSPAFTAAAVLSLALGIGANTAIFTLLNAVVLRTLPIAKPRELVQLGYTLPANGPENWNAWFGYPHLERFRAESKTLSGVYGGVRLGRVNVGFHGMAGIAQGEAYTDNFFSLLGVIPQRGRLFAAGEDIGGATVVVLSDRYFQSRFGADPTIVGQAITLNEIPFTVIGVTPTEFRGTAVGSAPDFWVPLHALDRLKPDPNRWRAAFDSWLQIAGRLQPGVSRSQAEAELDTIHRRLLAEQLAASDRRNSPEMQRRVRESHLVVREAATGTFSGLRQRYGLALQLLMCVAGAVLLISCANVANLTLARASRRRREIAVRIALGSGRRRVIRQLLTESLLLACAGGTLALAIAWWGGAALVRMISTGDAPLPLDVRPDWAVFGFTAALSLLCAVLFGLTPAIRGTRVDPAPALKEGARSAAGSSRALDRALVALQVMLSVALLTGAGLFARTLGNLRNVEVGYDRANVLMFSTDVTLAGYPQSKAAALYQEILHKAAAIPGVDSAGVSIVRPVDDQYYLVDRMDTVDGRRLPEHDAIQVAWNSLSPGYFATVGTPLLLGRDFEVRDDQAATPVAIVNESLARKAFAGQNPLGHKLGVAEIIGVVKDSLYNGARDRLQPVFYRPLFQKSGGIDFSSWVGVGALSFELRYRAGAGLVEEVRRAVASVDPHLPVFRVKTLRAQTEDSLLRERLLALLSTFFGGLALVLACLGLYGLMAYAVARRTGEIGIRMALGAHRKQIVWLVTREGLALAGAGIAAGIPLAVWGSLYAKALLFGVRAADPLTIAVPALVLIAVAGIAGALPALRALRVDPMTALRYE